MLCSYDLDPPRFRAVLYPEMTRRGRQFRTLVMADAGALQVRFRDSGQATFDRYEVAPVRCRKGGVFHAKVVLLRAGDNYLIGIGSSNLTAGGFGGNLELMLFADHTTDEGRELMGGATSFLQRLAASDHVLLSATTRRFLEITLAGIKPARNAIFDSLDGPLLPQMVTAHRQAGNTRASSLTVVSPWHTTGASPDGTDPQVVTQLRRQFEISGQVQVCTQGQNGAAPDLGSSVDVRIRQETAKDDAAGSEDDAYDRRPGRLHAKAYLVRGGRGGTLFFGSANCTKPALLLSTSAHGNVEVLVASRLSDANLRTMERDLQELFTPPSRRTHVAQPHRPPSAPKGVILAAQVKAAGHPILQVEAPEVVRQDVVIARVSGASATVSVTIRKGNGIVDSTRDLNKLFPGGVPQRDSESWSTVLWERVGRACVPFPVTVPLCEPSSALADQAILELLDEERGCWPDCDASRIGKTDNTDDAPEDEAVYDEDEERALTEAHHQGELDRLAVNAALLRRRVDQRFEDSASRRAYLKLRVDAIRLAPHLAGVLNDFLFSKSGRRSSR
ncbi:MAG: hypothetical protein HYS13_09585 [Planctomycetia bacterium]|nr:hypothetical protein [Planctomycetia bacterium]